MNKGTGLPERILLFYWTVGDRKVVLTDIEETELTRRAGFSPLETLSFNINWGGKRNPLQDRMGRFLEDYAQRDPEGFEREYVHRKGVGPDSLPELQALIDSYSQTVGRMEWERPWGSWDQQLGLLRRRDTSDVVRLLILHPMRFLWRRRYIVAARLVLPKADICQFEGTGESFVLSTSTTSVVADRDFVEVQQKSPAL